MDKSIYSRSKMARTGTDDVYANVLLKDGKIFFWKTCFSELSRVRDFCKSFYFTNQKMRDVVQTGVFTVESAKMTKKGHEGYLEAKEFYKKYEIHPDSKGLPPYEVVENAN